MIQLIIRHLDFVCLRRPLVFPQLPGGEPLVSILTLCDHSEACRSWSQWLCWLLLESQSAQTHNLLSHSHHKPPRTKNALVTLFVNYVNQLADKAAFNNDLKNTVFEKGCTLHDKMLPKAEKVSQRALLSIDSSMFLMKMFPTPDFLRPGSRCDHMILIGRPLMTSQFIVSRAHSALMWRKVRFTIQRSA